MGIRQDDRFIFDRLLSGATGTTDGTWYNLQGNHPVTITIEGTFAATVQVLVSNNPDRPLDSFNDCPRPDGIDHTTPSVITIDAAYKWVKVRVSAYTSGTISAFILGGPGPNAC
jgi:hypothetical protein